MNELVTNLSVIAEDDGDRYPAHVKELAEAAANRIDALEAQIAEARKALGMMLKEHDILSGNFGDVMDPKHKRPDRWPTAAEAACRALTGGQEDG